MATTCEGGLCIDFCFMCRTYRICIESSPSSWIFMPAVSRKRQREKHLFESNAHTLVVKSKRFNVSLVIRWRVSFSLLITQTRSSMINHFFPYRCRTTALWHIYSIVHHVSVFIPYAEITLSFMRRIHLFPQKKLTTKTELVLNAGKCCRALIAWIRDSHFIGFYRIESFGAKRILFHFFSCFSTNANQLTTHHHHLHLFSMFLNQLNTVCSLLITFNRQIVDTLYSLVFLSPVILSFFCQILVRSFVITTLA